MTLWHCTIRSWHFNRMYCIHFHWSTRSRKILF